MTSPRAGKQSNGSHRYDIGAGFEAVRMGNNEWLIFRAGVEYSENGFNVYRRTLRECRLWVKGKTE